MFWWGVHSDPHPLLSYLCVSLQKERNALKILVRPGPPTTTTDGDGASFGGSGRDNKKERGWKEGRRREKERGEGRPLALCTENREMKFNQVAQAGVD